MPVARAGRRERLVDRILVRRIDADERARLHHEPIRLAGIGQRCAAEHFLVVDVGIAKLGLSEDADRIPAGQRHALPQILQRHAAATVEERLIGQSLPERLDVVIAFAVGDAEGRPIERRLEWKSPQFRLLLEVDRAADDVFRGPEVLPQQKARRHEFLAIRGEAVRAVVVGEVAGGIPAAQVEVQEVLDRPAVFGAVEPSQHRVLIDRPAAGVGHECAFKRQHCRVPFLGRGLLLVGRRHRAPLDLLEGS